jgi:hypothetical protein
LGPGEARVSRRASATEQRLSYVSLGAAIDLAVDIGDRRNRVIALGAEALRAQLPGDVYAHGRASPTRLVADASFQLGADDADAAGEGDLSLHLLAARDSKDNALAQSKNGSVVRDRFGDTHIPVCFLSRSTTSLRACSHPSSTSTAPACSPTINATASGACASATAMGP